MVNATLSSGTALLTTLNIFLLLIFFLSYIEGINSQWFNSLKMPSIDVWIPRAAWIISTVLYYVGLYLILLTSSSNRALVFNDLYIIGGFLAILWSATFYQFENIGVAVWFSFILFLYQLWLLIYFFYLQPLLSLFLVPITIMYFYLVYSMIEFAFLNNVPL